MKWGGKGKQEEKGKQEKKDKQEKKERGKKGTLLRLGGYLMHYKWYLAAALLLTVGSNLFALIGPMLSGYAVDAIEPGPGRVIFSRVFYYAAWMAVFMWYPLFFLICFRY